MKVLLAPGGLWPEPAGVPLVSTSGGLPAGRVAACLARGWHAARPDDDLTLLPMADGGPGSAQVLTGERIASREVIQGQGPLGQVREVDLLRLRTAPPRAGGSHPGVGRTWFLDAARLLALPSDPDEGAEEAQQGSTYGLGQVVGAALQRTRPSDTLLVGMPRSAVHDGGAGALDALGGTQTAMGLIAGCSLGLALADDITLGGMSGAGATLVDVTSLGPQQAQELDRRACAAAAEAVSAADALRQSASYGPRMLPVISALDDVRRPVLSPGAGPTAPSRLTTSTWGTGAAGGGAMALRALGAWVRPGARVMSALVDLPGAVIGQDLVVAAGGELYDVPADGVVGVVGRYAGAQALPVILVCGRCAAARGEVAAAGISAVYGLQEPHAAEPWYTSAPEALEERLIDLGSRLARTWSR